MKRFVLMGAALTLLGVGCIPDIDLNRKVTDLNPFGEVSRSERLALTRSITYENGLTLVLHPTFLGVTGTVADVFGGQDGRTEARLDLADGEALDWTRTDRRETQDSIDARAAHVAESREGAPPARVLETVTRSGRLAFARSDDDRRMLLPAFWTDGDTLVEGNGVLWLTSDAHARLKQGQKVQWSLGLGNPALEKAGDVLRTFNETAARIFGDEEDVSSPFDMELQTEDGLFAVRIDGKVETVEVLQAKSWFANYLILDNPDHPLILKVTIDPVAAEALNAFNPLGVDTKALGYEITEIRR